MSPNKVHWSADASLPPLLSIEKQTDDLLLGGDNLWVGQTRVLVAHFFQQKRLEKKRASLLKTLCPWNTLII